MNSSLEDRIKHYPHLLHLPDDKEVERIANVIQQHQQASLEIGEKLKDAQTSHEILRQQHQDNRKESSLEDQEENNAKYSASKELITQLGDERRRIIADLDILIGPLHPIRRCPTDILQEIFEWVVLINRYTIRRATILSHVCYRWRIVAIGSPGLWRNIVPSLIRPLSSDPQARFKSPQSIQDYWTRTVERVRGAAAWIYFGEVPDDPEVWEGLKKCRFDLLPNIEYLGFRLKSNSAAVNLATCELSIYPEPSQNPPNNSGNSNSTECRDKEYTGSRIGHLTIGGYWRNPEDFLTVDPTRLIRRFAGRNIQVTELDLGEFDFRNFRSNYDPNLQDCTEDMSNMVFPTVLNITINNCLNIPLELLAKTFPNATKVRLTDITLRDPRDWPHSQNSSGDGSGDHILWPEAVTFTVTSAEYLGLRRLKLPKVEWLDLPGLSSNVADTNLGLEDEICVGNGIFTDFLEDHSTILHLHTRNLVGCGLRMARNASQLICLSIPATEASSVLEFQNLRSLRLFQRKSEEISAELFEKIVRKHFLPIHFQTSQTQDAAIPSESSQMNQRIPSQIVPKEVDRLSEECWWGCREPWERWSDGKLDEKDHPYPVLIILIPRRETFPLQWMEHTLVASAVLAVTKERLRSEKFISYAFKWE